MIDYEKLKLAHELAEKLYDSDNNYVIYTRFSAPDLSITLSHNATIMELGCIDDLIAKLQDLTQPKPGYISEVLEEILPIKDALTLDCGTYRVIDGRFYKIKKLQPPKPKYEVGQEIWFLNCDGKIESLYIDSIGNQGNRLCYEQLTKGKYIPISMDAYPSRKALIQAQIDYWSRLRIEEVYTSPITATFGRVCTHKIDPDHNICMTCHAYVGRAIE